MGTSGRSFSSATSATLLPRSGRRSPIPSICASGLRSIPIEPRDRRHREALHRGSADAARVRDAHQAADTPKALEFSWGGKDIRWELEPLGGGTRLTLWHNIDRRYIAMGAAGWHICFDVLDRLLAGEPIGRLVGPEAMKFDGWQRLNAEYAKQFGVGTQ